MVAFVLGFVLTLPSIWAPEYKSQASVMAPSFSSIRGNVYTVERYIGPGSGTDEDNERLLSFFKSDSLRNYLVATFNLEEHYGLAGIEDIHTRAAKLRDIYADKVQYGLSSYSTVDITVYDEDPQLAQQIAAEALSRGQAFVESIANRRNLVTVIKTKLDSLDIVMESIGDTIEFYRINYGVFNGYNLSDPYAAMLSREFKTDNFRKYYDKVRFLEDRLGYFSRMRVESEEELQMLQQSLANHPQFLQVLAYPVVNNAKARPNRLLIIVLFTLGGVLFSVFGVLATEQLRRDTAPQAKA